MLRPHLIIPATRRTVDQRPAIFRAHERTCLRVTACSQSRSVANLQTPHYISSWTPVLSAACFFCFFRWPQPPSGRRSLGKQAGATRSQVTHFRWFLLPRLSRDQEVSKTKSSLLLAGQELAHQTKTGTRQRTDSPNKKRSVNLRDVGFVIFQPSAFHTSMACPHHGGPSSRERKENTPLSLVSSPPGPILRHHPISLQIVGQAHGRACGSRMRASEGEKSSANPLRATRRSLAPHTAHRTVPRPSTRFTGKPDHQQIMIEPEKRKDLIRAPHLLPSHTQTRDHGVSTARNARPPSPDPAGRRIVARWLNHKPDRRTRSRPYVCA